MPSVARDGQAVMAGGRRTGTGSFCLAFARRGCLLGACECVLSGKAPRSAVRENPSGRRRGGGGATGQKGCRRRLRGGNGGVGGHLWPARPGCYRAVSCLPGVTDAGRGCVYLSRVSSRDSRPVPGRRLCDGLVPAASLIRVSG